MQERKLTLSRDELLVALTLMGVKTMNGLPPEPLEGLEEDEIAARLNSGEHSLRSRGLLKYDDETTAVLSRGVVGLVGGCVNPNVSMALVRTTTGKEGVAHYFAAARGHLLEHYSPRPGIYTIEYLEGYGLVQDHSRTLLQELEQLEDSGLGQGGSCQASQLETLLDPVADPSIEQTRASLREGGLTETVAGALAEDQSELVKWFVLVAWDIRASDRPSGDSIMVLSTSSRAWLVENASELGDYVSIRSASGAECVQALLERAERLKDDGESEG